MTELDVAVDELRIWLEENGKCGGDTDNIDVDAGELDNVFYDNTENRGRGNRQFDDNTPISSNDCNTVGRMVGVGWNSNTVHSVVEFNPELVSYHHNSLLKIDHHKIFVHQPTPTNIRISSTLVFKVTTWVSEACSSGSSGSECDSDFFASESNSRRRVSNSSSDETTLPGCETPHVWNNNRLR